MEKFSARLKQDDRPFKDVLPEALAGAERVRTEVRARPTRILQVGFESQDATVRKLSPAPLPRPHIKIDDDKNSLRELADIASRDFNSQLVIIQSPK